MLVSLNFGYTHVSIIEIQALTKVFSPGRGLFGLDLAVPEHDIFGFLGPNGSGKTTTIRLLLDFLRPTSGQARVLGMDCRRDSVAIRSRLGYVPGEVRLPEHLTGRELIRYLAALRDRPVPQVRLREISEALDLTLDLRIKALSKGNKQKIALAQALLFDPPLLILDEPTEGLDPLVQHAFYELLEEYRKRGGTIFMSSHMLSEVERICDHVAIIRAGKLVTVERVDELVRKKVRNLQVVFGTDVGREEVCRGLPGLELRSWDGRRADFAVSGPVDPVVKRLAEFEVVDLTFAPVSLEEAFLDFYRTASPGESGDGRGAEVASGAGREAASGAAGASPSRLGPDGTAGIRTEAASGEGSEVTP